jgi:hypothetical protein
MNNNSQSKSQKGQWLKGVSGNPAGRPRGRRNKATLAMEAALEQGAEQLIKKVMTTALEGDMAAMRLCLERILPARRDRVVHLDLPPIRTAQQNFEAMSMIFTAIGDGQITPAEGEIMTNIVAAQTNILQAEELENRLKKIEGLVTPDKVQR